MPPSSIGSAFTFPGVALQRASAAAPAAQDNRIVASRNPSVQRGNTPCAVEFTNEHGIVTARNVRESTQLRPVLQLPKRAAVAGGEMHRGEIEGGPLLRTFAGLPIGFHPPIIKLRSRIDCSAESRRRISRRR
jgi:hypothetical protein